MTEIINIYCDESCHLENDSSDFMVLGATTCPSKDRHKIFNEIRNLKESNNLSRSYELKWTKISKGQSNFYKDVIKYFYNNNSLSFRGLLIPKKEIRKELNIKKWEDFYYFMYHFLLLSLLNPNKSYNIYMDIKDTRGAKKRKIIFDVLSKIKKELNYKKDINILNVQAVHSHHVELVQITDLIIGAIGYTNRNIKTSSTKLEVVEQLKNITGYNLRQDGFLGDDKFSIIRLGNKLEELHE